MHNLEVLFTIAMHKQNKSTYMEGMFNDQSYSFTFWNNQRGISPYSKYTILSGQIMSIAKNINDKIFVLCKTKLFF